MNDREHMNRAQLEAVTWTGGPLLVLAGPGSGKTFTIVNRILHLLRQGTPPERILVITFTKEAALSMQRRFRETAPTPRPVNFGTFHSVFFQILLRSNVLKSKDLLNPSEKMELIIPILQKNHERSEQLSRQELREDAAAFLSAVSYYKNTLMMEKAAQKAPLEYRRDFPRLMEEYRRAARICGKPDFDDMLSECRRCLLEDAGLRKTWQQRFDHILIDEFQDINPVQYEVIKLLADDTCRIFAVGDDDQAIYGFRGSEPECMKRFEREYGAERLLLNINYRSAPQIVRASLSVIRENRERFVKELISDPERKREDAGKGVCLRPFEDREEQYAFLLGRLKDFLRENAGKENSKCAVLFRTNAEMQKTALRLGAAGIAYVMGERMQSIYQHFIVRDVMAYLLVADGSGDREALIRIVNRPSRYVSREAIGGAAPTVEGLLKYYGTKAEMSESIRKNVMESLQSLDRQLKALKRLSPGPAVSYVQKAVGYERYLKKLAGGDREKWEQWQEILKWLKTDAAGFADVRQWREAQEMYGVALKRNHAGNQGRIKGNGQAGGQRFGEANGADEDCAPEIHLMTVHASKGLEFDTVIIPDCNEKVFPHGALLSDEEAEEERRIFYVAMTRARENLELLYLSGKGESSALPSRFLKPLLRSQ